MALPPTETPGTHHLITTPPLVFTPLGTFQITKVTEENFEIDTKEDINNMDLCDFTKDASPTPTTPLIGKEFKKEWEIVWEVFPRALG